MKKRLLVLWMVLLLCLPVFSAAFGMPESTLHTYGWASEEINQAFKSKYPQIDIKRVGEEGINETTEGVFGLIQSDTGEIDVFIVNPGSINFQRIMDKEYAYPLSQNYVIQNGVERMYPFWQEGISRRGEIYALPVLPELRPTMYYSTAILNEVGLLEKDLPATYSELLDLYKRWYDEIEINYPSLGFYGYPVGRENFISDITAEYVHYYDNIDETLNFDTPLYRNLMEKTDEVFENLTPITRIDGMTEEEGLFENISEILLNWSGPYKPIFIKLDEGLDPVGVNSANLAFINPRSNNMPAAMAYMEELIHQYTPKEKIFLYADENEAVLDETNINWLKEVEEQLTNVKKQLETVNEREKAALEEELLNLERVLAGGEQEGNRWLAEQEAIDWFNQHISVFYVPREQLLYSADKDKNINLLLDDYCFNRISLNQFIEEANRRVQMVTLEDQ